MTASRNAVPTSPWKGEVDRAAGGRGSRFARTKALTKRARQLRSKMKDAETRLWHAIRREQLNGLHFRRQHPIGPFILDFYCARLRLAIELDGGQHAEQQKQADERRTRWLAEKGVIVVRYWNNDIFDNLQGVLADLVVRLEARARNVTPSPTLPLSGRGRAADQERSAADQERSAAAHGGSTP